MRSDLVQTKINLNQQTSGLADCYAPHRDRVMQLIEATVTQLQAGTTGKLSSGVLIGPGNCLDVDLPRLNELFESIHCVDVDARTVNSVIDGADVASGAFTVHAPADIAEPLLSLTSRDLSGEESNVEHLTNVLQTLSSENGVPDVPESDVAVSLCVMSQLIGSLQELIPENHPSFVNAMRAIRIGHLRRLLSMLRKGGVAVLVTDVVSSDTVEDLRTTDEAKLPGLLRELIESRNFFSGTNPSTVLNDLNMLNRLPDGPESVHSMDPWLWHVGERSYAVYALRIQKKLPVEEVESSDDGDDVEA